MNGKIISTSFNQYYEIGFFTKGRQFIWARDSDLESFNPQSTSFEGVERDSNAQFEARPED